MQFSGNQMKKLAMAYSWIVHSNHTLHQFIDMWGQQTNNGPSSLQLKCKTRRQHAQLGSVKEALPR